MTADRPRTVLLAAGDRLYAASARALLDGHKEWKVAAVAGDGLQALGAIGRQPPDAVLVIGDLPRIGPAALARQVRRRWPQVLIVVLGEADTRDATVLPAEASTESVLRALATPAPLVGQESKAQEARPDGLAILGSLTPRERVILKMLAEGLVIADVAGRLGVSQHTVRTHMQNLYAKLGCHSRLDVVRFAARHGLVGSQTGI